MFNDLPIEMLLHIFSFLTPETQLRAMPVNTHTALALNVKRADVLMFWRNKFERHFPHRFTSLSNQININWYDQFRQYYASEYVGLLAHDINIFSLVKEGDVKGLKRFHLRLSDLLHKQDKNLVSLFEWAQEKNDQLMLDYFFQLAIKEHTVGLTVNTISKDKENRTIFYWAIATRQRPEQISLLLLQGSSLNEEYFGIKFKPLHIAVQEGQLDIVKRIIETNPQLLEQSDSLGQTPLLWAAAGGHADIVAYLLGKNANLNSASNKPRDQDHGKTPLFWAVERGYTKVVELLVKAGADTRVVVGQWQYQPILIAAQEGWFDIVKKLIEYNPQLLEESDTHGQTSLLWAAAKNHPDIVAYLIGKNANLNSVTSRPGNKDHGKTALYWAVERGFNEVVELLVKADAETNTAVGGSQYQPIHIASQKGRLDVVKTLIENNPQLLEEEDAFGQTSLIWAAGKGHADIVDYLINKKANLNCATDSPGSKSHGKTPLYWAVERGFNEVVKLLVKAGAKTNTAVGGMQYQPIHIVVQKGQLDLVKTLIEHNPKLLEQKDANGQTPLIWAAANGHADVVAYLIRKRAKLNGATNIPGDKDHGKTPLYWAVERGNSKVVKLLLKAGAETNTAVGEEKMQPIHLAAQDGRLGIVKILFRGDPALLEQTNKLGQTPLFFAAVNGRENVVAYLIRKKPSDIDEDNAALYVAAERGYDSVVHLLLTHGMKPDKGKPLDKTRLTVVVKKEVELVEYISKKQNQDEYFSSFTIFGHTFKLRYSKNEKIQAATELQAYVFESSPVLKAQKKQMLVNCQRVLKDGGLGKISRGLFKA